MLKKIFFIGTIVLGMASCSEKSGEWDPYANWQSRNAAWFEQISDSARTAIAEAKAQYGDAWEDHCEWRRFKTLLKASDYDSKLATDSICVRIINKGERDVEGAISPFYNDTVRASYRCFLMPTQYVSVDGSLYETAYVADQSYYGAFNASTAAPSPMAVTKTVEGFSTALQYMVPGDEWMVYIPQELAYGATGSTNTSGVTTIPGYSTLRFHLHLAAVYRNGSGVPEWK